MEARGRDKRTRSEDGGGGGGGDEAAMDRTRMRYLRRLTVPGTIHLGLYRYPVYLRRFRVQYYTRYVQNDFFLGGGGVFGGYRGTANFLPS